jgi:carboxymethylenebutenolidase
LDNVCPNYNDRLDRSAFQVNPVLNTFKWRNTMNLFQKYLVEEFAEDYQEGHLSRRDALKLIGAITGSLFLANSILGSDPLSGQASEPREPVPAPKRTPTPAASMQPTPAASMQPTPAAPQVIVKQDDPAVIAGEETFPGQDAATLLGYLSRPSASSTYPLVLVCHENRGLTDHIKDITRRLAKEGYASLAVDLLSRQGGSSKLNSEDVPGVLGNIAPEVFVQDFTSGLLFLKKQSFVKPDKVGMVGFCFGGGVTWQVAVHMPELLAAVPFYGPPPVVEDIPKIKAAVLAFYGGQDTRITSTAPTIEKAMKDNGKVYEKMIYPDAGHAFFNNTGTRYNAPAAADAWKRTLAWFDKYLS